ncbi:F-box protein At4g35733-like [Silene latifolia]|uniref:F-box protein At4g35733-like n=1 Tax=Silene latifolia TaxID=37657 RepID=UPI003D77CC0A
MSSHKWADLPREILELIGKCLETRVEVYRFRAICSSWRSVIPLSTSISSISPPFNLPPPLSVTAVLSPVFFYLLEDETRTASCLIKVTQSTSGEMKIMDPLSSQYSIRKNSLTPAKSINILNLRLVQVFKSYRFIYYMHKPTLDITVKRFVLFGKCGIFMVNDAGELRCFRFHDQNWTNLGDEGTKYDDVVVYKGQYYVVDTLGTVYWIDSESMTLVQFSPPLFGLGQVKNLIVSGGELFVVDTYYDDGQSQRLVDDFERVDMRIYRLDEEWGRWVDVRSLDDRVFLLAKEGCFSVSTKDIPGCNCNCNCVYFSEAKMQDRYLTTEFKRFFARVFDIQDRKRMKMVDCYPSHRKLFDLLMNFPCTLSPPEFPVNLE